MTYVRPGKIEDFERLNQDWAWGTDEWQRQAQIDFIQGIKTGDQEFLVAEDAGQLVGELHIFWKKKDMDEADGKTRAYLSAFRVHPEHRGKGFGRELMRQVQERIKARGFTSATVGADVDEEELQALYQRWGFTDLVKGVPQQQIDGHTHPTYFLYKKRL